MAEQDPKKTPDHGPMPDPHADKPPPRPDPHTRPEPGARARRPDQYEDLGPVPELFGAAGVEAATWVSDDPALKEEAIRRGAESEGLETAQIFGLLVATAFVIVALVVAVAVMMTRAGIVEEERRAAAAAYPELHDLRRAERQHLSSYGHDPTEDRFHISLERAQQLMAEEARQVEAPPDHELPERRADFNLSYARWGIPGLAPAPGSPAALALDPRPLELETTDPEDVPAIEEEVVDEPAAPDSRLQPTPPVD